MSTSELQKLINTYLDKIKGTSIINRAFLGMTLFPAERSYIAALAQHQEDVIRVITVLPGKYTYEQVEAAIRASGVSPSTIYYDLAANQRTMALERFYEALNGPR